jgi:hypothetical protein
MKSRLSLKIGGTKDVAFQMKDNSPPVTWLLFSSILPTFKTRKEVVDQILFVVEEVFVSLIPIPLPGR